MQMLLGTRPILWMSGQACGGPWHMKTKCSVVPGAVTQFQRLLSRKGSHRENLVSELQFSVVMPWPLIKSQMLRSIIKWHWVGIKRRVSNQVWGEVKATVAAWRVSFGAARRVERLPGALTEPDGGWVASDKDRFVAQMGSPWGFPERYWEGNLVKGLLSCREAQWGSCWDGLGRRRKYSHFSVSLAYWWITKALDTQVSLWNGVVFACTLWTSSNHLQVISRLLIVPNTASVCCKEMLVCGKFKFCFLELTEIFFLCK